MLNHTHKNLLTLQVPPTNHRKKFKFAFQKRNKVTTTYSIRLLFKLHAHALQSLKFNLPHANQKAT